MSSENVDLRKHMSSEQERWRALERSRAKQDERRRTEMEQKCDDIHALRYRLDVLAGCWRSFCFRFVLGSIFISWYCAAGDFFRVGNAQINVTTAPMGNVFVTSKPCSWHIIVVVVHKVYGVKSIRFCCFCCIHAILLLLSTGYKNSRRGFQVRQRGGKGRKRTHGVARRWSGEGKSPYPLDWILPCQHSYSKAAFTSVHMSTSFAALWRAAGNTFVSSF